ncbi:MAG: primosomal protein N' [Chloroflexi bacterium]|nr:primosomal protein N' [Chloroflexota bacterium]
MTLGLDEPEWARPSETAAARLVEVAVDAAGGRAQTYTYAVPPELADLEAGEAVLVEFGRRQALGIVVADTDRAPAATPRPIVARVRADGPLLPPLSLRLGDWIAVHYLAPPALVLRAMLPPGLLERLELLAERLPDGLETTSGAPGPGLERVPDPSRADLLQQLERGPRPVRDLAGPDGRAGLLRRLRALEAEGLVSLELTLLGAGAGPRYERWVRINADGRAAMAPGVRRAGRRLGPRQSAALRELADGATGETPVAELAGRHGQAAVASLVRRGLVDADVRERPRRPLASRVDRLRADLDARIALLHSGLGDGERADEWRRIRAGDVDIVVGTRLAVAAPLADVGLVIVDEEHDAAYKSDRTPRLQARDCAVQLAALAGAAVVLGSATPAVDSVGYAEAGVFDRVILEARPIGRPPTVEVVDLREELAAGQRGLLSRSLVAALRGLDPGAGDQAILVLNRRGTASVVLCRDCGHVQACPDCDRPLVYHQAGTTLRCHHCGRATPVATRCPACGSPRIRYLGGGTERLEREVRETIPGLRVGRLDRDVVEHRGAAERVVDAFSDGRLDVLVGTSLVTKGLDIPTVTLVGVVSSDVALNLPDERAAERTYQLLVQAIGRAGRGARPGHAVIQTYQPDHPAIVAAASGRHEAFYEAELALRRRFGSPPFGRLVKLTVGLADQRAAETEAASMAERLRAQALARGGGVTVVGPAPAYIARRADRWRWNVVLRGDDPVVLLEGGLDAPWSVDVDPESLL